MFFVELQFDDYASIGKQVVIFFNKLIDNSFNWRLTAERSDFSRDKSHEPRRINIYA